MTAVLDVDARTLPRVLERLAGADSERVLVQSPNWILTRAQAAHLAMHASELLRGVGVGVGDTVGIVLDNGLEFLAGWWGAAVAGAVEVPVGVREGDDRLLHIVNDARCRWLITSADHVERIDRLADQLTTLETLLVVGEATSTRFVTVRFETNTTAIAWKPADVDARDPVAVLYTSGSTGPAKGAVIPHGQHYVNGWQPTELLDLDDRDRWYVSLPLHHNMAQGYGFWPALVAGGSVHLAERFSTATFWADVRASAATVWPFVGAMLVLVAKQTSPAEGVGKLRVGYGVPIPADTHRTFEATFGVRLVHCYGSTEATIVTWDHVEPRTFGSVGRPIAGFDVTVLDDSGNPVPAGEIGEICTRPQWPSSMFSGYLANPAATVAAWRDLWFHTGDRGRFDDDDKLWFVDRTGDVIRRMGENISSHEVESAVMAHPDVDLCAAFAVPSELIEDEVMVVVVRRRAATVDAAELRSWCATRLPGYAVPRFVEFADDLPLTPTGKVQKFVLRARGVTPSTDDSREPGNGAGT